MSALKQSIIKTVCYFDIVEYPLTAWEIYTLLYSDLRYEYTDILSALKTTPIEEKNGFYFLKGRSIIVDIRQKRYISNVIKIKKARRAARVFSRLPFIRLIAVCNNLAFFNGKRESDLDMFFIVSTGALPFVRVLTVLLSIVFFKRPRIHSTEDTVCLSFFVDRTRRALSDIALSGGDVYLQYWIMTLLPFYDSDGNQYREWLEENRALLKTFPHHVPRVSTALRISPSILFQRFFELMCFLFLHPYISQKIFFFQLKRLPNELRSEMNISTSVLIKKNIFKTHLNDQRALVREQWSERYNAHGR